MSNFLGRCTEEKNVAIVGMVYIALSPCRLLGEIVVESLCRDIGDGIESDKSFLHISTN